MKVFLVWVGIVCCGVANGLICDYVQSPIKYCCIVAVCVCASFLLVVHRRYTKDWNLSMDEKESDYPSIFRGSVVLSLLVGVESVVICGNGNYGFLVGCITVFVSFCVAAMREKNYVI